MPIDALSVLCAQLTRDLLAIAKFLLRKAYTVGLYVRPILEYASTVWSPHFIKYINSIENVQRNFTKRISFITVVRYMGRV